MKIKKIAVASLLLLSLAGFAQKDELKTLKKVLSKDAPSASDVQSYKDNAAKLSGLATEEGDKVYAAFYSAAVPIIELKAAGNLAAAAQNPAAFSPDKLVQLGQAVEATLEYEKKSGKKVLTDELNKIAATYKGFLINQAVELGKQKNYADATKLLYATYLIDKKDQDKLYYAANYAVMGKDYESAMKYYKELKALNYSGEGMVYYAKNLASGQEESFGDNKVTRDNFVKLKTHTDPRDEKIPSKRGEIYTNIALILSEQGKIEEAKKAITEARAANPSDNSLITTEADLYLKTKDYANYERLIKEVLEKNPNDATLNFNLGVIASQNGKTQDAEKYYKRAIEIDPKYTNAYLNLAILKLDPEKDLVDQMNKLGTSASDTKKYEVLKKQRLELFTNTLPYLEKAYELSPDSREVAQTLANVYSALDMTDKAKALKAKIKAMP